MSNGKNIWVSLPNDYRYVNSYSIGMNIPNKYDYPAYRTAELEYFADINNKNKGQKSKALGEYGQQIVDQIRYYKSFEVLPDGLWVEDENKLPKPNEYIFQILGGAIILNEACANILKQFRLGNSTLTPVQIHKIFSNELWFEETFYFFNLCELREYVVVPQSHDNFIFSEVGTYPKYSDLNLILDDGMLEIHQSALDCDVDVWHVRTFRGSFFFSDALHQVLAEQNMLEQWNMKSCKLIYSQFKPK